MSDNLFPIRMGLGISSIAAWTFLGLSRKKAREAAEECRRHSKAEGEIVAWIDGRTGGGEDSEPGPCHVAQVRFRSAEGRDFVFDSTQTVVGEKPQPGSRVEVWYLTDDPGVATLQSPRTRWGEVMVLLAFGLFALGLAAFLLYANFHPEVMPVGEPD